MMDMVELGESNGKVTGKHMTNDHEKSLFGNETQHFRTLRKCSLHLRVIGKSMRAGGYAAFVRG